MLSCDVCGDVEPETLVGAVKVTSDLLVVVLVVACTSGDLDFLYVRMLCHIGGPLYDGTRASNG